MRVLRPEWTWTPEGVREGLDIRVDAGLIVGCNRADRHSDDVTLLPGKLVIPGLVNAHSHAFQRAFRGHVQWRGPGDDDFWTWRRAMYATANALDPDGVEAVSRLAFLEMAEAGVTRVGEFHYLQHQPGGTPYVDKDELARRVIAAALDVGIRIALLRVAYARAGAGKPLEPHQLRFGDRSPDDVLAALDRLKSTDARVTLGLAPHSVRAVPRDWLTALSAWKGVVHAHVAEQPAEVQACEAEYGRSPLRVFADAGLVSERFTAVHLTQPSPGDVDLARSSGASVCVCPSTELDLGDGFLPLSVREGVRLCVGSDSQATIDLLGASTNMIGPHSDTPQSFPPSAEHSACASANARLAESIGMGGSACVRARTGKESSNGATATDRFFMDPISVRKTQPEVNTARLST
jgi:formimidoylglutamate deiminase